MANRLSATLIVRDEATMLAGYLESLDGLGDPGTAYDIRLFGPWPVACLALCCLRLERHQESAGHHAQLEAWLPGDPGHRARRLLAEARARADGA
jgi:hypothetical protein